MIFQGEGGGLEVNVILPKSLTRVLHPCPNR